MFSYSQSTGLLSHNNKPLGYGYSGHGQGLNNPKMEMVHSVGPIPKGLWTIGEFFDDHHLGVCVASLKPKDQDVYGRSGFYIHGDNRLMNHTASDGCVILSYNLRELIKDSSDTELEVIN